MQTMWFIFADEDIYITPEKLKRSPGTPDMCEVFDWEYSVKYPDSLHPDSLHMEMY